MSHRVWGKKNGAESKKEFWSGLIPVCLISALPAFYLYAQNAFLCPIGEVLPMMGLMLGIGVIAYLVLYFLFSRRAAAASIAGTVCMALFSYFGSLCSVAEQLTGSEQSRYGYLLAAVIAAALLIPLFLLRKKSFLRYVRAALCVFLTVVFAMNAVYAVSGAAKRLKLNRESVIPVVESAAYQPDLYYIILDEYAERDTMRNCFDTDLTPLYDELTKQGFSISTDSRNATSMTRWNIANNLCLSDDAVSAETDEETVLRIAADARIYHVLADLGYHVYAIENLKDVFNCEKIMEFDDMGLSGVTISGKTAGKLLFENTMLRPVAWKLPDMSWEGTIASAILDYLSDPSNLGTEGNRAVLCHLLTPHPPYSHHADGTIKPREEWYDYDADNEAPFYLEQHAYVTDRLYDVVSSILSNNPDCVLILQSDHNFRFSAVPEDEHCRIFNAVYFRGEPIDIEGLSGPETLRLVLERLGAKIDD